MIPARLEKLKFIVEEMQRAFHLTMHLSDPFVQGCLVGRFSGGFGIPSGADM